MLPCSGTRTCAMLWSLVVAWWYSGLFCITDVSPQIFPIWRKLCVQRAGSLQPLLPSAKGEIYTRHLFLIVRNSRESLLYYLILDNIFLSHLKLLFWKIILEILHWVAACKQEQVIHAHQDLPVLTSLTIDQRWQW